MKLKDLKVELKEKKITIDNNEYNLKAWTSKQQKEYLKLIKKDDIKEHELYNLLIKNNVQEKTEHLSSIDLKYILIHLSILSINDKIKVKVCDCIGEKDLFIDDIVNFIDDKKKSFYIDDLDITIEFKTLTLKERESIEIDDIIDVASDLLIKSISKILRDEEEIIFTEEELDNFMSSLNSKTYTNIINYFKDSLNEIKYKHEYICKCSDVDQTKTKTWDEIPNILWR